MTPGNTISYRLLSFASQPVFHALSKLHYKDVVGDSFKDLAEDKAFSIHCSPLMYTASDDIIGSYQIGQA